MTSDMSNNVTNKNGQISVLCPFCSHRFLGDPNSTYADCPICGGRIFYEEVYF